jgi:hypothetical protein
VKLVTVKSPETIKLKGVTLDWRVEDKQPVSVTITDRRGRTITIAKGESYTAGLKVYEPEPVQTEERFALVGEVSGVKVKGLFASEREAKDAMFDLNNGRSGDALTIQPVAVPVDDKGDPINVPDELIPF